MFKLSIDLRQFFTTDYVPRIIHDNTIESFIANLISYLPQTTIDDATEYFENELEFQDISFIEDKNYLADHVFEDIILDRGMIFALLSPFFDEQDLAITSDDAQMESWYDKHNEQFVDLGTGYIPQIKKEFEKELYFAAIDCCTDEKGNVDEYLLGTVRLNICHVRFKDKSKARKFRKLYKKHYEIRALFNEFGFLFRNGQLAKGNVTDIECEDIQEFETAFSLMNEAINIISEHSKKQRGDSDELETLLCDANGKTLKRLRVSALINTFIDTLSTNEEVIM